MVKTLKQLEDEIVERVREHEREAHAERAREVKWREEELPKIEQEYRLELITTAIEHCIAFAVQKIEERQELYVKISPSVPFQERRKVITAEDYQRWGRMKVKYEDLLKNHTLLPLPVWLLYAERGKLKTIGLQRYIINNMDYFV